MHWSSGRVDHPAGERYIQTCANEWDSFELPICIPPQILNRHNYIRSRLKFMWRMYISWGQSFELSLVAAKLNYYLGTPIETHFDNIWVSYSLLLVKWCFAVEEGGKGDLHQPPEGDHPTETLPTRRRMRRIADDHQITAFTAPRLEHALSCSLASQLCHEHG